MIVVDSSALVAIALKEPERDVFLEVLQQTDAAYIAPTNFTETGMVLMQRGFISDATDLVEFLDAHEVRIREDVALASIALTAFRVYGKGRSPARLNLADCFSYALAKTLDAPLLYKGDDFAKTDIRSAL